MKQFFQTLEVNFWNFIIPIEKKDSPELKFFRKSPIYERLQTIIFIICWCSFGFAIGLIIAPFL
ncbi:MAG: hypothetical protein ABIG43_02600 [Chloroflexota bacterium]